MYLEKHDVRVFGGQLLVERRYGVTWSAPCCRKVLQMVKSGQTFLYKCNVSARIGDIKIKLEPTNHHS